MQDPKPTAEQAFRSSLEDVEIIARSLSPYCKTVEDLIILVQSGMSYDVHLRMMMDAVQQQTQQRRKQP